MKIKAVVHYYEGVWRDICKEILQKEQTNDKRFFQIEIDYKSNTTLADVVEQVRCDEHIKNFERVTSIAFIRDNVRYWICDEDAKLAFLLKKYIDPDSTGEIYIEAFAIYATGRICVEDGIRYYMHSHEAGRHNEPHVHIYAKGEDDVATVSILTGKLLAGNLPRKLLKIAKRKIMKERKFFIRCWETKTDGLAVDVNKAFNIDL